MVCDQGRAIPSRSPLTARGATPAADRAELMAEVKQDSSEVVADAGDMLMPWATTAPIAPTVRRARILRDCFMDCLLRRSGGLPSGRSMTLRPRVAPGLPFSVRCMYFIGSRKRSLHDACAPNPATRCQPG